MVRASGVVEQPKIQETALSDKMRLSASKTPKQKPWQDQWGNPLPDAELKAISQNWNAKEWEVYLKSTEGNLKEKTGKKWDTLQKVETFVSRGDEQLHENAHHDRAEAQSIEQEAQKFTKAPIIETEENHAVPKEDEAETEEKDWAQLVQDGLEFVTPSERFVLEKYFCEGWSEPHIAREMRLTRATIQTWKRRGIKKIHDRLSSVLPICERGTESPNGSTDSEIEPKAVQNTNFPGKSITRPSNIGPSSHDQSQD